MPSWTNESKSPSNDIILMENGDHLLTESSDKLVLEGASGGSQSWTNINKT